MDLIVIAQLITGIATLIVASVLIWQMFIQKKTLDIAHNDNDANMSLSAMESRSAQSRWFAENSNQDMLEKMKKGFEYLNDEEKLIVSAHFENHSQVLATEWRLGRMGKNKQYPKFTFREKILMGKYKAMRDLFKQQYFTQVGGEFNMVDKEFLDIGKEVWEEVEGKKMIKDKKLG